MKKLGYAVVTGASAGIGIYFAEGLAQRGYSLVLVARREDRLKQLADRLVELYKVDCRVVCCDVSKTEECKRLIKEIDDIDIEVFINNAGFGDCCPFIKGDLQKELNMVDVNVKAVHTLTKLVLQKMQGADKGYILNIASSAGLIPAGPYMATYYATKAYVTSLTQAIARELKETKSKIYIGCVCPGPVDTEFNSVANVEFALQGISAEYCAQYSLKKMFQKKTVIIPTIVMKLALFGVRLIPRKWYIAITAKQQKKKLYTNAERTLL
ncbi:MAG: SDR family NAD(P)-dependent oxidoreductase [Agathobacter sp.]